MTNREILFRAKPKDKRYGEWVYGYIYKHDPPLVCFSNDPKGLPEWYILKTGFADWCMPRPVDFTEVDPNTIAQWTGEIDENGEKIFSNISGNPKLMEEMNE